MSARCLKPRQSDGFTLLELLVVIGLIGVITTWGYVILFRVDAEWNDLRRRTELSDAADTIFETMRADFGALAPSKLSGVSISGVEGEYRDPSRVLRDMYNDSVTLPILGPENRAAQKIRYYVDRSEGRDAIVREATPLGAAMSSITPLYPQVNVAYLRCEFATETENGLEWLLGWERPEPPTAVRISMTLENPDYPYIQVSRKAVFDVRVP